LTESSSRLHPIQTNYLIAALGEIDDEQISTTLIDFANNLVDINERCQKPKSKQPVWEEDPVKAKAYWQILKALGQMSVGAKNAGGWDPPLQFLYTALSDYAPDKRACALESLMKLHKNNPQLPLPEPAQQILQLALRDPSPIMQLSALASIANLEQTDLMSDIIPLIDSQENTVSRQALASIARLYKSNTFNQPGSSIARQQIAAALQAKLNTIREEHKKIGILDILRT
jgi:hypothetical protein